ncbi:MAG: hypothetical protein WCC59_19115 [Terriglobales bacterium]
MARNEMTFVYSLGPRAGPAGGDGKALRPKKFVELPGVVRLSGSPEDDSGGAIPDSREFCAEDGSGSNGRALGSELLTGGLLAGTPLPNIFVNAPSSSAGRAGSADSSDPNIPVNAASWPEDMRAGGAASVVRRASGDADSGETLKILVNAPGPPLEVAGPEEGFCDS